MKTVILFFIMLIPLMSFGQYEEAQTFGNLTFRPVDPINYIYPIGFYNYSKVYYEKRFEDKLPLLETVKYATKEDTCFIREDRNLYFSDIPKDKIVDLLPNETVAIHITEVKKGGGLTFKGAASLSSKKTSYKVTMDYIKFVTINVANSTEIISYARIGVGLRLVASIKTKKSGINLGDLFAIGLAASKKDLNGSLSVNVLGVEGPEITALLPMPAEISSSSIQNAMQALAAIKSKIYERGKVELTPQVVSIRSVDEQLSTNELIFNTSKYLKESLPSKIFITNKSIIEMAPSLLKCGKCD